MLIPEFDLILYEDFEVTKPKYKGFQNWTLDIPENNAEKGHIDFVLSGRADVTIDGKTYTASANQILFIPKDTAYFCKVSGQYSYYSFHFMYSSSLPDNKLPFPVAFTPSEPEYFIKNYKRAYNLYIIQPKGYKMKIREIFYNILNKLYDDYINTQINPESYKIRKSIDYLQNNFTNTEIDFTEVASLSGITDTHFRRIFKKIYAAAPSKYVNDLRINKAKSMLTNSNVSIDEIAHKCGYKDYSYFARIFQRTTGYTPTKYRARFSNTIL